LLAYFRRLKPTDEASINFICIHFHFNFSFAQNKQAFIHGLVYDTASKKGLAYATVSIVGIKDSTLISFTRADSSGKFVLKNISKGSYLLSASYVGFVPVWQDISVKDGESLSLGNINLTDLKNASAVTVIAKRAPVVMNNDTLEFNTENFKTQPNAVVEDLLKKLPGVTVDGDGTVKVNGQKINRVLVNGKEFFTGDPKLATKNLDADAVDKVQVFDKKTDRAEFTGVDDGLSEKAINLKLKKIVTNRSSEKSLLVLGTMGNTMPKPISISLMAINSYLPWEWQTIQIAKVFLSMMC